MNQRSFDLNSEWLSHVKTEFDQPYMQQLQLFLQSEKNNGKVIYPDDENVFSALNITPLSKVKVVILGQDPYHGPDQAHGLSFSVPHGVAMPPSLLNIHKELATDLDCQMPLHGNLTAWAEQGVLLLNAVLTVEQAQAASHRGKGWERFTDRLINLINQQRNGVVFLLWGAYAQKKGSAIDQDKHLVLQAPHPSPLSSYRGFFGCRHFSQANGYLKKNGQSPIDWQIS